MLMLGKVGVLILMCVSFFYLRWFVMVIGIKGDCVRIFFFVFLILVFVRGISF